MYAVSLGRATVPVMLVLLRVLDEVVEVGVTLSGVAGAVTSMIGVLCRDEEERLSRLALLPFFLDVEGAMVVVVMSHTSFGR